EMLERYVNKWSDEKKLENIKRIQKSVEHMIEMLNETLSISKADAGKIAFAPQRFEAVSLCRSILDEIAPIKGDGHILTLICEDEQLFCTQDNKLLATVLTNLISNAIKYSPHGGEIKLSLEKTDSGIRYTVADQGIGIEENDLREIFQPFFRGKNIGGIKGTGLGLSIVKKYLEIIGGAIEINSELGKGTAIVVDVPAIN
ncbi:MAG TPA: HAMP domain-containing sensor histidine kinase, partial [Ignavibacteriales bacterium]|nr:HAMP domain-containing sensor histidine kinase [Ignavibacteriales bacterium]